MADYFGGYDNPERAFEVWESYQEEVRNLSLRNLAEEALLECKTAVDLDARLAGLVEFEEGQGKTGKHDRSVSPGFKSDQDSFGSWPTVVREYES